MDPVTLNDLLAKSKPLNDRKVSHEGQSFEVMVDSHGDIWATLPNKNALPTFWDWVGTPTQKFTVYVDYTTGQLPPRTLGSEVPSDTP